MLTISTFNIKNDYFKYKKEKEQDIINYLLLNKIDILNLQELYKRLDKELIKDITINNYKRIGSYRFKSKILLNPINESTPIITNKKIVSYENYNLPHYPSLLKRIMTKVEIEYNNEIISIYNTHLDYKFNEVKEKELDFIYNIIKQDKNKIILTGDFNLKNNKEIFNNFVSKLNDLNIKRVELNDKTLKQSKYHRAIDHIFISNSFTIIESKIIKDLEISDHYPLLISIK